MAVKTFTSEVLTSADTNTYLANAGLVYITETVSTGTATSLSINNCFTSTYANYRIVCSWDAGSAGTAYVTMRMRAAGSDTAGTAYSSFQVYTTEAANGIDRFNATSNWSIGVNGTSGRMQTIFDLTAPQLAKVTTYRGQGLDIRGAASYTSIDIFGMLNNSTQYDGFTLFSSGNITGKTTVYGYRQA